MIEAIQNVRDFNEKDSFTSGLQEAIDALPKSGGIVWVPPGIYTLQRHVQLRSNVTIRGAGQSSRITRTPEVSSPLASEAQEGEISVHVEDGSEFSIGMEVSVFDTAQHGWYATHAVVVDVSENRLHLDRPINRPCLPERNGGVAHAFSAFVGWEERGCELESLCVDGSNANGQSVFVDFTVSAIHLVRTIDARVRGCVIQGWLADGVSVQGGVGAIVSDCLAENCLGHGFHPGTSVQHSLWTNNIGRDNDRDGLYFCMNVRHSVVSESTFYGNSRHGIGGLADGGDQYNVVANNTCVNNACPASTHLVAETTPLTAISA